jgi:Papain family cysteine protease
MLRSNLHQPKKLFFSWPIFLLPIFLFLFSTNANGQDFVRIKNRWQKDGRTDYRIHIQNPSVDAGATDPNWWSAQWVMEKVEGTEFYRFKNRWQKDGKTNFYLHNQNGKIEPGWWSAMWSLEKVEGNFYRIKNRWVPTQCLHIEGPTLAAGPVQPNMWSAMWEIEGFNGNVNNNNNNNNTGQNTTGPRITGVGLGALATPAANLTLVRKANQVQANAPAAMAPGSVGATPAILNLDMPPIGFQGNEGSCVAWACAYGVKSFEMKKATGVDFIGPSANLFSIASPEYLFNRINVNNQDCTKGSYFVGDDQNRGALDVLKSEGVLAWAYEPYSDKDGCGKVENSKEVANPLAAPNRIKNYARILDLSPTSLKTLLNDQHPIIFAVRVSDEFMSAGPGFVWKSGLGGPLSGHAMVIMGYDDAKKAYKVQNSWGTNWGDKGYTWLDYEFAKTAIMEAYVTYSDNLNFFNVTVPGYVSVYCEAGYVAWCKLTYTQSNGEQKVIEENLSLGFTFRKPIPTGAVNITLEVGGYGVLDKLNLKQTWPTATVQACYKIWGTIFDTEYGNISCSY